MATEIALSGFAWFLTVATGCGGLGCGNFNLSPMPDYETCEKARQGVFMTPNVGQQQSVEDGYANYAACMVREVGDGQYRTPPAWVIKP